MEKHSESTSYHDSVLFKAVTNELKPTLVGRLPCLSIKGWFLDRYTANISNSAATPLNTNKYELTSTVVIPKLSVVLDEQLECVNFVKLNHKI